MAFVKTFQDNDSRLSIIDYFQITKKNTKRSIQLLNLKKNYMARQIADLPVTGS